MPVYLKWDSDAWDKQDADWDTYTNGASTALPNKDSTFSFLERLLESKHLEVKVEGNRAVEAKFDTKGVGMALDPLFAYCARISEQK